MKRNAQRYSIEGLEFGSETRPLFEEIRDQIRGLGGDVIELPSEKTVTYRVFDFFAEIIPRSKRLTLILNLDFEEADDPTQNAKDATERAFITHATQDGGVLYRIDRQEDIAGAMHLIRQAYEKVVE